MKYFEITPVQIGLKIMIPFMVAIESLTEQLTVILQRVMT